MRDAKNRSQVERTLRNNAKLDKARTRIGRISQFGLLEMSRQRLAPPIDFGSSVPCVFCRGRGWTPSTEAMALRFLRRLKIEASKAGMKYVRGTVPKAVADYVLNRKRKEISELETRLGLSVHIEGDQALLPDECHIACDPECSG
jgi:ribonuclease E